MKNQLEIARLDGENCLITRKKIKKDSIIHILSGKYSEKRTKYSIQVGPINIIDDLFKYANHSFTPNVEVKGIIVKAIKDIKAGDQITFNYHTTEDEITCPFTDKETNRLVT